MSASFSPTNDVTKPPKSLSPDMEMDINEGDINVNANLPPTILPPVENLLAGNSSINPEPTIPTETEKEAKISVGAKSECQIEGSETFHSILQEIDRDLRKFDTPFGDISGVGSVGSKVLRLDDVAGGVGKAKARSGLTLVGCCKRPISV